MENLPSYSSFINSPRSSEETNADKLPSYSSFINGTPPEEVGVVHGIARGLKSGLTQDLPSAVGKAMQFVGVEEAGKSLTTFAEQNAVPEDQQGFWEKGARAIGTVLPMIVAGAVAPVAGVVAGVAGGAIFGLSQAHETEKALQERGIEPGIAPYLTGGATAAAMTLLPIMTGRIFNGPIANLVGKELSKQTAESVIRPSAGKILQDYGIKALETQLIFAGQTLSVAGIEKAYGVPREIASEMLESAKTGIAFSAFAAPGMAVRRAVDSSHLKTLANPWKPEDVASMPSELQGKYLQRHAENRSGYAEAIGNAIEKGGDPDTAKLWHDYAYKQIERNEPIDTGMTLDPINLKAKLLEREVLDTSTTIKKGDAGENIGETLVVETPEPVVEETVTKEILPVEETLAKDKQSPFEYQDSHQEQVHKEFGNGQYYRYNALEGAGDIFREFALHGDNADIGYISEKISHIEDQINKERTGIHPDDTFATSLQKNPEAFAKMEQQWSEQPTDSDIQKTSVELNKAMLNGDFATAEKHIQVIKDYFKSPKELNLSPALSVDGEIFKAGENHGDIYNSVPKEKLESAKDLQTGYVDQTGKWYTDQQAREAIGVTSNQEVLKAVPAPEIKAAEPVLTEEQKKTVELEDKRQKASEDLVALDRDKPQKPKKGASVQEEAAYQNKLKDWKADREPLQKAMDEIDTTITVSRETPEQKKAKDVSDALTALGKETEISKVEKVIAANPEETAAQITKRIVQSLPTKVKTVKAEAEPTATSEGKQPWEMTKEEFTEIADVKGDVVSWPGEGIVKGKPPWQFGTVNEVYDRLIKQALSEGKPVPPEVLADYPDLAKQPVHETEVGGVKVFKGDVRGNVDIGFKPKEQQIADLQKAIDANPASPWAKQYQKAINKLESPDKVIKGKGTAEVKAKIAADKAAKEEAAVVERKAGTERMRKSLSIDTEPEHLDYVLSDYISRLQQGEGGGKKGADDTGDKYLGGSYPEWFSEVVKKFGNAKTSPNGRVIKIDRDSAVNILKKGIEGKKLTGLQQYVWEEANRAADKDATSGDYKGVIDQIREATNEWTGEKARLTEEGADSGAVEENIGSATETLRSDLEAKGYSPEDVEIVIQELKNETLKPKETPKGDFKNAEIPEVKAKEDILSNPETEWSKPLSEQEIVKNQDMFGTEEGLKKAAKDYSDKTPDDKVAVAEDILKNDKITEEKGKTTRDFCNGGK